MKLISVVALLGLASSAVAAKCPNGPSRIACGQACDRVVRNACASCNGNTSCVIACTNAREAACSKCCDTRCATC
ncbi:uncharacterized protein DNG_10276 [Cephalotrichum gorgonifer]|uniref:Uncharacterized protein n=1 Tax=Cephalotrichum gorgonifer TaxID=2041049 RepID=A0AAE8N7A9_9PEZI|nr:uncharacterized protein DNG_10276 [Cephalotrichum gorgonifer]